jgi:3-dehydroquinate dehydratase-2
VKCFLVISVPGPDISETRQASSHSEASLEDIHRDLERRAEVLQVRVECRQLGSEGAVIDCLQDAAGRFDGVIINAGALSSCSYALRSAIGATLLPCVEVSISDAHAHEEGGHKSVVAPVCAGVIGGFGRRGYLLALEALVNLSAA